MSEVAPIITAIGSLIIAIVTAINLVLSYKSKQMINSQTSTMTLLEKNTNSIKDALVKATAEKSFAEGVKSETDKLKS